MDGCLAPPSARPARIRILRFSGTAQALHWLTGVLMFTVLPLAWVMTAVAKDNPNRAMLFALHKSIGVTILLLTMMRLLWRATNPAPSFPASMTRWDANSAKLSHWLLYVVLVVMPISGYVLSSAGGHPVTFFGLFAFPALPQNKGAAKLADEIHLVAQWAVYGLIALHILATAWHIVVRRDGILDRMLPEQSSAG
ncbi:MAG: cytochrome b [Beijerinckiaceae bacterium]